MNHGAMSGVYFFVIITYTASRTCSVCEKLELCVKFVGHDQGFLCKPNSFTSMCTYPWINDPRYAFKTTSVENTLFFLIPFVQVASS